MMSVGEGGGGGGAAVAAGGEDGEERERRGRLQAQPQVQVQERESRERERTRVRERRRRAITGRILEGLRRHGGYRLPPRADINHVLRALAHEAGWVVLSDGTTFRPLPHPHPHPHHLNHRLQYCTSDCAAAAPTSSHVIGGCAADQPTVGPAADRVGGAGADAASYVELDAGGGGGDEQARHVAYAQLLNAWGSKHGEPLD